MDLLRTNPFVDTHFVRAQGCTLWDASGKPCLDLLSGTWCSVLGHSHPRWMEAVRDQVGRIVHTAAPFVADEVRGALDRLADTLPPQLDRAVLSNSGSEAVELSLKLALAATGREGIAVIERGYFGATIFAFSLSEVGRNFPFIPKPRGVLRLPAPDCRRCPKDRTFPGCGYACLDALESVEGLAAVMYEPVFGVGAILVPPPGYGARLRELAARKGALLIAEEITTGMGRTGRWFGFEHDGIVPDIVAIGKAIGGGLPVAAVATTADVESRCSAFRHVQSHQNDPFSGRIAATVIDILREERLVDASETKGRHLLERLGALAARREGIANVRGRGLMAGIELTPDFASRGTDIQRKLFELGFLVDYQPQTSTFRLFPPYVIGMEELDAFVAALDEAMG